MKLLHIFTIPDTAKTFFDGQFRYLTDKGYIIDLISCDGEISDFCLKNHVNFKAINISRGIDIKSDIIAIYHIIKIIKTEKYDGVFGHTPKGALVAMLASWISKVPNRVYYRHGLVYTTAKGIKRLILKSVERFTALLATNIINVSSSLSQLAIKENLNANNKQLIIGHGTCGGIDTLNTFNPMLVNQSDLSKLKQNLGISEKDFIIGFCGRICKDKGIVELVKGFELFQQSHPEISSKLLLIGGYDTRDILPEDVKKNISENPCIINVGTIPHQSIPPYYSIMDVFVFPSYREGFGMSVLEASAMEIPILVSKSHGCIDSIMENITGLYIDVAPESIFQKLNELLNYSLRKKLGKCGRDFVTRNYDFSVMWPEIEKVYSKILN